MFLTLIALKPHCLVLLATSKLFHIPGPLPQLCLLPGMVFLLPSWSWLLLVTIGLAYTGSHACSPSRPDKSTLLRISWWILFFPPFVLNHVGITLSGFATWEHPCLCHCIPYRISKGFLPDERSLDVCSVTPVMPDSLRPHGLESIRLLSPSGSPGKNACGVPCPLPGNLPNTGMEPVSPASSALQVESLLPSHWGCPDLRHT